MDMSGWGRVSLYGEVLGITGNGHRQTHITENILLATLLTAGINRMVKVTGDIETKSLLFYFCKNIWNCFKYR